MTQPHDPTPKVNCRYGAPMGRPTRAQGDVLPSDPPMYLRRIPIDSGGYDRGGAYWGLGQPLYWACNHDADVELFFRAPNRVSAMLMVREDYPDARFYR